MVPPRTVVATAVCLALCASACSATAQATASASGSKLMIGYFFNLYKYDPKGGAVPLPPGVTSPVELLEQEMDAIIPLYDVVIQAFINPSQYNGSAIVDSTELQEWREGVNGKPGLKALCAKHGVPLMVSMGGGGAPRFVNEDPALVEALYQYAATHGYAGVDIDEENTVPVDTYVGFLTALGNRLKSGAAAPPMNVSCTIGPLSCCVQSRGICKAAPYIDWAFMMLYDGLEQGGGWDITSETGHSLWQASGGDTYCGITPHGPQQHGIVSFVGAGACQFLDFALYLNWPADKIVFGMPLYSHVSPPVVWYQVMEEGYTAGSDDSTLLMTPYSKGAGGTGSSVYLVSPTDVTTRIKYTLNPETSMLGVSLDNSGWHSRIMSCGKFDANSTMVHSTVKGIGFWQMSFEDQAHHEVSAAARAAISAINTRGE